LQLAHLDSNKVLRAYNHARWLDQRADMMQWYADYLDESRKGVFVKPLAFASLKKPFPHSEPEKPATAATPCVSN
jgi:hypothetical protein